MRDFFRNKVLQYLFSIRAVLVTTWVAKSTYEVLFASVVTAMNNAKIFIVIVMLQFVYNLTNVVTVTDSNVCKILSHLYIKVSYLSGCHIFSTIIEIHNTPRWLINPLNSSSSNHITVTMQHNEDRTQ